MAIDFTKLRSQLTPEPDGEPPVHLRTGTVDAVNSDGTVNLIWTYLLPDGSTSITVVPNVPRLSSAHMVAGDVVNVAVHRGAMLVLGPAARTNVAGGIKVDTYASAGNHIWTKPAGAVRVLVEAVGGGGGSGGCAATAAGQVSLSGGGGGGSYVRRLYDASLVGSGVNLTVGAGGAGGTAGDNDGGTGGASSFTPFGMGMLAGGGGGGQGAPANATNVTNVGAAGGNGGTGSGGDLNVAGSDGWNAIVINGEYRSLGNGGASGLGFGGATRCSTAGGGAAGVAGKLYGGGAAGANSPQNTGARAGAAGGAGLVIVTTHF